jgi:rhamnulokinase
MGLWILQECRREWSKSGEEITYADLVAQAGTATPFRSLLDPDDAVFLRPGNMPARIVEYCVHTQQPAPETRGEFARCALESLALKYRFQLERLELLLGRKLRGLHMIGGGIQNELLCQLTADATARTITTGPVEATALGNVIMQMLALREIDSLSKGRELIRRSIEVKEYAPQAISQWDEVYERFKRLVPPL